MAKSQTDQRNKRGRKKESWFDESSKKKSFPNPSSSSSPWAFAFHIFSCYFFMSSFLFFFVFRLEGAKTVMTSEEASDGRCIKDCRQSKKLLVRIKQTQVIDSSKIYLLIIDGVENDDESNGQKEFYHDQVRFSNLPCSSLLNRNVH
ncbi:uncharacterized protein LOC110224551 [Arabidopsis lyrata subsp. lyrata]|uniref:uncharacterized protein LOC110224551 n=1 Tax=Arabidopsis lyrata subsp. lyrata TaxID=81972 RepID=UPI000A29CE4D|nr:uncharacterized protein LOC110224551 [Arabidopsis lyrata subsp. lyrata]XP_020866414.1 uncharacterized protein LOC110224551 [Arabidopsis lyrata subsp. lyrata]|eukprot:XP_020866408.1 uncharacterized protein LOC110224551 [Arabidopsis lyrata subsp. lyrata]